MKEIKIQERGWGGHFICCDKCRFTRNTLVSYKNINVVISTVGNYFYDNDQHRVGADRYYDTRIFHSDVNDEKYHDIDVEREVSIGIKWQIEFKDGDNEANNMHDDNVSEIVRMINVNIGF